MVLARRGVVPAVIGTVLVVLAVLTVLNAVHSASQLNASTACQQRLNAELRTSLDARANGADTIRAAQGAFLDALMTTGSLTDPATNAAMTRYRDVLRLDAQARAQNPIPRATSCQ